MSVVFAKDTELGMDDLSVELASFLEIPGSVLVDTGPYVSKRLAVRVSRYLH